jgi:hypothetical protein
LYYAQAAAAQRCFKEDSVGAGQFAFGSQGVWPIERGRQIPDGIVAWPQDHHAPAGPGLHHEAALQSGN